MYQLRNIGEYKASVKLYIDDGKERKALNAYTDIIVKLMRVVSQEETKVKEFESMLVKKCPLMVAKVEYDMDISEIELKM